MQVFGHDKNKNTMGHDSSEGYDTDDHIDDFYASDIIQRERRRQKKKAERDKNRRSQDESAFSFYTFPN